MTENRGKGHIALTPAPMIGRSIEDCIELRELVVDLGAICYLAPYRFDPLLEQ